MSHRGQRQAECSWSLTALVTPKSPIQGDTLQPPGSGTPEPPAGSLHDPGVGAGVGTVPWGPGDTECQGRGDPTHAGKGPGMRWSHRNPEHGKGGGPAGSPTAPRPSLSPASSRYPKHHRWHTGVSPRTQGGDRVTRVPTHTGTASRGRSRVPIGTAGVSHMSPHSPGVLTCIPTPPLQCSLLPVPQFPQLSSPVPATRVPEGHHGCRCPHALTVPGGSTSPSPRTHGTTRAGHTPPVPTSPPPHPPRTRSPLPAVPAHSATQCPLSPLSPSLPQPGGLGSGGRWPGAGGRPWVAAGSAAGEYFWSALCSFQSCDEDII